MTEYQPVTFADKPPGLEHVSQGTYSVEAPKAMGRWPLTPPGLPTENGGIVDEKGTEVGEEKGKQYQEEEEELAVANGYGELYEPVDIKGFDELPLPEGVITALTVDMNFEKPSRIQGLTLPHICKEPYPSLIAQAQNGCGKTCCFALCILSRIDLAEQLTPQAMVVVPTRELAIQNTNVLLTMGKHVGLTVLSTSKTDELHYQYYVQNGDVVIRQHVIVGTHGNLRIFRNLGWLFFNRLKVVVFDEADHMMDREGFGDDTTVMMATVDRDAKENGLPPPQLLMFSATYRDDLRTFANKLCFGRDTQQIWVPKEELNLDKIKQVRVRCSGYDGKLQAIKLIMNSATKKNGQTIIFVKYRQEAAELRDMLTNESWSVTAISGEMEYEMRDKVIDEFRKSVTSVLISTDVLSRGFDSSNVNLVINFQVPVTRSGEPAFETYLHRVGRTGRYKKKGAAFNLLNDRRPEGEWFIKRIEDYFQRDIPLLDVLDEDALIDFMKKADLGEDIE